MSDDRSLAKRIAAAGGILFFFIMAFEVMIMISPFAFFFYSVFSPVFNFLEQHTATRWATLFFLPHMILPPTLFLKSVRVAGSVLFLLGLATFTVCALQVYLGKIFKWGIAHRGLYSYIRHPQYLALGLWGMGMAILWPRFIVLATLSVMFVLYYFLAKDEERRMLSLYGESYQDFMARTGMFLPKALEAPFVALGQPAFPQPRRQIPGHAGAHRHPGHGQRCPAAADHPHVAIPGDLGQPHPGAHPAGGFRSGTPSPDRNFCGRDCRRGPFPEGG